jgi:hypothetical protein
LLAGLVPIWAGHTFAASLPPRFHFKTLHSGRIKVHFHVEVEGVARRTMALALEVLPRLEERYKVEVPSLDIVVDDARDSPNGLASSFPYPYVEIRAASPDGAESGPTESWLRVLVTHELTHIVHIEQARGIYAFGRRLFGRAPFLFPDALQPTWFIEGLAVREETRGTAFGRGRHTFTRMLVDEAARSGQLERMDQATLGLDVWPLGNAAYLFGEEFLNWLEKAQGEDATREVTSTHSSSLPYLDERTFRKVTGRSLTALWREFARERALGVVERGVPGEDGSQPLTTRGVVQSSPRLSPDGLRLAYTSRTLDGLGEIRLMNADGSADRRLATRLSGGGLSWSPDGRFLVFDETNQVRKFETRSDLHRIDIGTGHRKRVTTGLRASDPDFAPAGGTAGPVIVFVQRFADRSELSMLSEDGTSRVLTRSTVGTEWSHPRFSPKGDGLVASRMTGGFLDLVLIDASTGAVTPLTHDRAVDAEPAWVNEDIIIFRSDRDEDSFRLFLLNRDGSQLRRLRGTPDNAFGPEADGRTGTVFYGRYSSRGFDLARSPLCEGLAAGVFDDDLPALTEEPPPFEGAALPYRSWSGLRPRFVTPYLESEAHEWRVGLATASLDPLFRTTYGLAGSWGTRVSKVNALGYIRYDRFTPTFTALARVESSPSAGGTRDLVEGRLSAEFPLERSILRSQFVDLTVRRRRENTETSTLDGGVIALSWQLDSTRTYPMSISPEGGVKLRVAATREIEALGSDLDFGKFIVDGRAYLRIGKTVAALRAGAGWTFGPRVPRRTFGVGGLPSPAFLDPVGDEPAVLRGYEAPDGADDSRYGRKIAFGNIEWRVPLGHPQKGVRALPFFVRHVYLTASLDAAVVSARSLNLSTARVGASLALGADLLIGHRIPVTLQAGVGRGLTRDGGSVPWFSVGFPF